MDEKVDSCESPSSQVLEVSSTYIKPQGRKPYDKDVTFEEYSYYAQRTREEQKAIEAVKLNWREIVLRKKNEHDAKEVGVHMPHLTAENFADAQHRLEISDEEWTNASRAFRTASWGACE